MLTCFVSGFWCALYLCIESPSWGHWRFLELKWQKKTNLLLKLMDATDCLWSLPLLRYLELKSLPEFCFVQNSRLWAGEITLWGLFISSWRLLLLYRLWRRRLMFLTNASGWGIFYFRSRLHIFILSMIIMSRISTRRHPFLCSLTMGFVLCLSCLDWCYSYP